MLLAEEKLSETIYGVHGAEFRKTLQTEECTLTLVVLAQKNIFLNLKGTTDVSVHIEADRQSRKASRSGRGRGVEKRRWGDRGGLDPRLLTGPDSSERTSEQVHESEQRGDHAGLGGGETELVLEVGGGDVVDGQLHTEASGVLAEQQPRVDVDESLWLWVREKTRETGERRGCWRVFFLTVQRQQEVWGTGHQMTSVIIQKQASLRRF